MKKIGLIGGSGPESTLIYYKELNTIINERTKETCFPELTIDNINLYKFMAFRENNDMEGMKDYLLEHIRNLQKAGCECAALTAGTLHMVYDRLAEESPIPLISIPKAAALEAKNRGYARAGLLGTEPTMRMDYLKKEFTALGIEVYTPHEEDIKLVHQRIFEELEKAIIKESTLKELQEIIAGMRDEYGIEAVILGCTELPLILNEENSPVPVLDIMRIHIQRLAEIILEEK